MPTTDQIRRHNRRQSLIAQGICVQCGSRPAVKNQDGSQGLKCKEHRAIPGAYRATVTQAKRGHLAPSQAWDAGFYDYRDSKEFKRFCSTVKDVIVKHGPVTSREIKTLLGEYDPTWLSESLFMLMGEIEEVGVNLVRYRLAR